MNRTPFPTWRLRLACLRPTFCTLLSVWLLIQPGRTAALRKIVWLEFAGNLWDANVIPMILIIERTPAQVSRIVKAIKLLYGRRR